MKTVVSFSGGRTSAYMLKMLLDRGQDIIPVFANTGKERIETLDFVRDCGIQWGVHITWLEWRLGVDFDSYAIVTHETASRNGEPFEALINKANHTPGVRVRWCTDKLKIRVIRRYLNDLYSYKIPKDTQIAIGIREDERKRANNGGDTRAFKSVYPLVAAGITKDIVDEYWRNSPFDLNLDSNAGNCDLCFLKAKGKLVDLLRKRPEAANWWIDMEERTNSTFSARHSYKDLLAMSKLPLKFDVEEGGGVSCFCTD